MDHKNVFMFTELLSFTFFLLVKIALSADWRFESCLPQTCGNGLNISYPFWIEGNQSPFCGSPGFGISCKNNEPIFKMSGDDHVIHDIVYDNQSVWITKVGMPNDICSPLNYGQTFSHSFFTLVPSNFHLFLLNCTTSLASEYSRYSIGCTTDNLRHRSLVFLSDDPMLESVNRSGQCETLAVIPIDRIGNESLISRNLVIAFLNKGFHLRWNAGVCSECAESKGRCGFDFDAYKFMCFCPDRPHQQRCGSSKDKKRKIGIVFGAAIGGMSVIIVLIFCWKRKYSSTNFIVFVKKSKNDQRVVEDFLKSYGSLAPKRYNYSGIKKITSSFKHKIGQGGFGCVFRGELIDGRLVAVKVLNKSKGDGEEFINEVASISRTSHVNVVSLLGFCFDGSKRALIYEFMANGSLEKFIYEQNPLHANSHLGWETLYQIAIGVARGLEYLHRGCNTRILHFDIKPHNILLDQDFCPKISDFGLAKLCPRKESIISMLGARGTAGYIAPEVFSRNFGGVSHKSDVYSYGMMVLEMVGGRKNIDVGVDRISEIYFPHWIYQRVKLDEDLGLHGVISKEDEEITRKMIFVALWCIQTNPMDRPSMSRAVEMLEGSHELLLIPPKPYLCSPSRDPVDSSIA